MLNRTYPESDWQFFKQILNIWFSFADYRELPYRFSRAMLPLNLAALIRQGKESKADVEDLKGFSKQLQHDVRVLLGDKSVLEQFHGLKRGARGTEDAE